MFSSNELLHLVFANEDDTFYCDNLLKLDLNQYLWWTLHQEGYRVVYFLHPCKDGFTVQTFGDKDRNPYLPEKGVLKRYFQSETKRFGDWMLQRLKAKTTERAAFVCQLHDFCHTAQGEEWYKILGTIADMKNRTGIILLTASPEAEQSRDLLLSGKVFDALKETAITGLRGGEVCRMYQSLASRKPNAVVYLNAITLDRMRALLLHVVMDHPDYYADPAQMEQCAEYLTQYYRNPWLRKHTVLFGGPGYNDPKYCDIYQLLKNRTNWNRLLEEVRQIYCGRSLQEYLEEITCRYFSEDDGQVCVTRDRKSVAGRCLALWMPQKKKRAGSAEEDDAFEKLMDIQSALRSPANKTDNPEIEHAVETLLDDLKSAQNRGDYDTFNRAVSSLRFCVQWISVPSGSEKEKSILPLYRAMETMLELSRVCFETEENLAHCSRMNMSYAIVEKQLSSLRATASAKREQLKKMEELVSASIVQLSVNDSTKEIADITSSFREQFEALQAEEVEAHDCELPEACPLYDPDEPDEPNEPDELTEEEEEFLHDTMFQWKPGSLD